MSTKRPEFLDKSQKFLSIAHPVVTGPNKYKSKFGRILELVFRKGYFTLQTLVMLADEVEKMPDLQIVVGGSMLDLSRRVFEDMIYMEYIAEKDKEKYTDQFLDYVAVDQKNDMEFLLSFGSTVEEQVQELVNKSYDQVPEKLRKRNNWSGQSVEQIIEWLVNKGLLNSSEKETVLKVYVAGNRKNHTSPSDILDHTTQELITGASERDIEMALMITHGSLIKIGLRLLDEIESSNELKNQFEASWKSINQQLYNLVG